PRRRRGRHREALGQRGGRDRAAATRLQRVYRLGVVLDGGGELGFASRHTMIMACLNFEDNYPQIVASRTEQKQRAKEARIAAEQSAAQAAARKRNLARLGAILGIVVLALVVAIVVSRGNGGGGGNAAGKVPASQTAAASRLFSGIPMHGTVVGKP